jgi:hypothetical protein
MPRLIERRIWTAAELERMSPPEQDAIFQASLVRDLDGVPPEFLDRVRAKVNRRIADIERSQHN